MFIVDPNPTFTHTVKVQVPTDGGFREDTLKATFNVIPTDEAQLFDLTDGTSSLEFLHRAIVKLDDLADANGDPLPYNDAVRDQLLGLQFVRTAIGRTYFNAISGARSGN